MNSATPRLPLILLLLVAGAVLVGGLTLARKEVVVRDDRHLGPLRQYAGTVQRVLHDLEETHERHLSELAAQLSPDDHVSAARACAAIEGVVQCSFLYPPGGQTEQTVQATGIPTGKYSIPTLGTPSLVKPEDFVPLRGDTIFNPSDSTHGWIELPGRPLYYWVRPVDQTVWVVLTIDPLTVRQAIQQWLTTWQVDHPAPTGAARTLLSPTDAFSTSELAPDWEQPLTTRYGSWLLASWSAHHIIVQWDRKTLITSIGIASFLAALAIFIHTQQRRAWQHAEQRVSFVNRVSHELRTPLTNMLLNLDIVSESLDDEHLAVGQRLNLVREEAGRLSRLIENVLTFSRQEQGAPVLRPTSCHPAQVVDTVLAQFEPSWQRRGIALSRGHEGSHQPALLDSDALSQIVANLLSNVEKYAPHAPAQVLTSQTAQSFTLRVTDGGPGIPNTHAQAVFRAFTRLRDGVSEGVSGTGLGLTIARELATRLGGTLDLEASERGASFVLRLPLTSA